MKLRTIAPAVTLVAAGLIATQPAQAAPQQTTATCSLVVPSRLSIGATNNNFVAKLGSNCPATINTAVWKSTPAATTYPEGRLQFLNHAREVSFTVLGEVPPIGTVAWKPAGGATDFNGVKVADLASATSVSRCASVAALTGGRKGSRTALLTTVSYWRPNSSRYVRWANKQVLIQYQDIGSTTWKGLAYVTTDSVGQVTYNYSPNRTRRYRVYVAGTSSIWNVFSPVISR
ncbi:hypothetical protein [Kribbella sp. NPDC004536]|uniref:hypothetical protein n=1 Tax=Kribbella sp. NPDC004536 TaxID=3364106 RepID=UPI0036AF8162